MNKASNENDTSSSNQTASDAPDVSAVVIHPSSKFWALVEYGYELEHAKLEHLCGDLDNGANNHGGHVSGVSPALRTRLKSAGALFSNLDKD